MSRLRTERKQLNTTQKLKNLQNSKNKEKNRFAGVIVIDRLSKCP
jgi:hypothetical protein